MNASSLIFSDRPGTQIRELLDKALADTRGHLTCPVSFIEQKSPNFDFLAETLRLSSHSGRWTNFGPVSFLLESALHRHLKLTPSRAVVMCSSGTAALLATVALKEYLARRRLRWVISAYGFRATCLGPLANAQVLDCTAGGILDLDALSRLSPDSWDGIVVTNVFGLKADLSDYVAFCQKLRKELIVDNAGLLDGFLHEDLPSTAGEILSFHQTKPWGMGEGGAAIVAAEHVPVFRAIINGAEGLRPDARTWASNSKISDISAALILQRLMQAPEWSRAYQEQACRILRVALGSGLRLLAPVDLTALTPPHLPMLALSPVSEADLANPFFVLHKYYQPLSAECPVAASLYARIVNIPCHPGMAALTDQEIRCCLHRLLG
jgi:dTDP-4-amino-4,6-dideoxygalactose transaminase